MDVVPATGAGVAVTFGTGQTNGAQVQLNGSDGLPLPVGTAVKLNGRVVDVPVGYDGLIWLEGLVSENELAAEMRGADASRMCLLMLGHWKPTRYWWRYATDHHSRSFLFFACGACSIHHADLFRVGAAARLWNGSRDWVDPSNTESRIVIACHGGETQTAKVCISITPYSSRAPYNVVSQCRPAWLHSYR